MAARPRQPQPRRRPRRWPWIILAFLIILSTAAAGGLYAGYLYYSYDLPKLDQMSDYRPKTVSRMFAADGAVMAEFFEERREVVPLSRMPRELVNAFVSAEDATFYDHPGISPRSILRAAIRNVEAGRIVQGGSTITQQVCKSFLLTPEKSFARKVKEAILAYQIDSKFTKSEILYLYLNQIYLGEGTYGVEAAAQTYFGKSVEKLTLAECAMLARLPQAPNRHSPRNNPKSAREGQIYVLNRMVEEGYISPAQAQEAAKERVVIKAARPRVRHAPYFVAHVRSLIEARYGSKALLEDGLRIYTTLDLKLQAEAEEALLKGLGELDKREGYRGPLERLGPEKLPAQVRKLAAQVKAEELEPGRVVTGAVSKVQPDRAVVELGPAQGLLALAETRWARKPNPDVPYFAHQIKDVGQALAVGDVILARLVEKLPDGKWKVALEQEPAAQGAVLSMDAATGQVKVLVGGRDYGQSQFNRATQARRQPGSSFKPFIYAAAFDKGFTPSSIIIDSPVVYTIKGTGRIWKPRNYKEKFYGPMTLRTALEQSRNVVTVKLLDQVGVTNVVGFAKHFGFTSELAPNLSLALGTSEVTPLEMLRAYSVFCNLGLKTEPVFITRVEDRNGSLLEEPGLNQELVIEPTTAYQVSHVLEGAVQNGTGQRIKALGKPAAGKTGTTNDTRDAWFCGYTPGIVTIVWTGHDDHSPMGDGETGSRTAAPIWLDYMKAATAGRPARTFQAPEGVIFARVDKSTGLLADGGSPPKGIVTEAFKPGTAPTRAAKAGPVASSASDFLKQELEQ